MANTLKLKRSAIQNRVPTTGDLQLGELALNTYDGKLYTKQDNGTVTIVEIGSASLNVLKTGDTMTGELRLPAATTALTPLHIPHGAVPTTLENGDMWTTTASLFGRINDSTRTFIHNGNPTSLASDISEAEAQAGTATSRRWFTALRVRQAIATYALPLGGGTLSGNLNNTSTGYLQVSVGTTAERTSANNGYLRYNTTLGCLESFVQGAWQIIANTNLDYGLITSASTTTFDYGAIA